jgi:hypothetical protein
MAVWCPQLLSLNALFAIHRLNANSAYTSSLNDRSISSQTMRTNSTLSRTCSRNGTVLALRYFACLNRKAAMRQAFSSHQSFGGWGVTRRCRASQSIGAFDRAAHDAFQHRRHDEEQRIKQDERRNVRDDEESLLVCDDAPTLWVDE